MVVESSSTAWPTCSSSREYRRCCCKSPTRRIDDQQSTCKRAQVEAMMALVDDVAYLAGTYLATAKAHCNIKLPTALTFPIERSKDYLTTIFFDLKFNILQSTRVSLCQSKVSNGPMPKPHKVTTSLSSNVSVRKKSQEFQVSLT